MRDLLKEKGFKATPARLAILDIFTKTNSPLSADVIIKDLKRSKNSKYINAATVYRTLGALEEAGVLTKVDFRKDSAFFELAKDHHHHIACLKCDTVEDFESREVEKVLGRIARNSSKFINIKEHSLELFGLCKSCIK